MTTTAIKAPPAIPVIDISSIESATTAAEMHAALRDVGFAYVINHGIEVYRIAKILEVSRSFFARPMSEKMAIAMKKAGPAWRGYFPPGAEYTRNVPDQKEGLYFGAEHDSTHPGVQNSWPMHGKNLWPSGPDVEAMRPLVSDYMRDLTTLAHRLMKLVANGLGIDSEYFRTRFTTDPTVLFRVFNYPKQEHPENSWGVGQHTDMGFLTILYQDHLGGLQILDKTGNWIDAPPRSDSFIINIGDMLQYWTRGIYRATLHRVRNTAKVDRLSLPFFFDPNWTSTLIPIDHQLLRTEDLERAKIDRKEDRWDGLNLSSLRPDMTYGEFVWNKIKDVFPELAAGVTTPSPRG